MVVFAPHTTDPKKQPQDAFSRFLMTQWTLFCLSWPFPNVQLSLPKRP